MAAPYSSLASWIPRPAPFNDSKHGTRVEFSEECSAAERESPELHHKNAVVYTAQPVPVGEVWRITVLNTTREWGGGLTVGLTTELPSDVPIQLYGRSAGPHDWLLWESSIRHNHDKYYRRIPFLLNDLTPGQSVGLLVTSNGQLHLFLDGKRCGEIATGLLVDTPLWGVADMYAKCTKIKSEIMSAPRGGSGMGPNPPGGQKVVEQLQQQLQAKEKDAEIQRKSTELQQEVEEVQLEEADTQRLAQEQHAPRGGSGMGPNPPGGQKVVQQLQQQLQAKEKDAEIQRKSTELQQKVEEVQLEEADTQRLAQEQHEEKKTPTLSTEHAAINEPLKSTIAMSDLVVSKDRLGGGAQGTVFKGTWRGIQVAVKKCLQPDPRDVRILLSLGTHSNVIQLYGVVVEDISCLIVTELVRGGSLFDFLYGEQKKTPSDDQRSYWMKDIAMGMGFLHHQGIAHRDLKSGNVLLGDRMTAKLCDFGTARSLDHTTSQSTVTGTYRWMAPEIVRDPKARINKKCDIYSYAMVLYELVTCKKPFHDAPTDQMAMFNAMLGQRPSLPESDSECAPFLRCLITTCWDADPKARPLFEEINIALDTKTFP